MDGRTPGLSDHASYEDSDAAGPRFFSAPVHDEALSRLGYLVESGRRCGLVLGPAGTGKSTVLQAFLEESLAQRWMPLFVNAASYGAREMLEALACGLGVSTKARGRIEALWNDVCDALSGREQSRRPSVIVIDHLDRARADARDVVRRLLLHDRGAGASTLILGFSGATFPAIAAEWRDAADLRVDVGPMDEFETSAFVGWLLAAASMPPEMFEVAANQAIFELTRGIARDIVRLCELSLLSAMGEDLPRITRNVVEAARRELSLLRSRPDVRSTL